MPFTFVDRVPSKLGRVKITPENGGTPYYAVMERADEPAVAGTPLSAANLNAAQDYLVYTSATSNSTWKRIYVGTNGKDTNAGTQAAPMATIGAAIKKYANWHKSLDIYLLDGTYTENVGSIATDQCSIAIRSASEDKEKVTLNMTTEMDTYLNVLRLYNMTINATVTDIRPITVSGGTLFAYNVRFSVPADSSSSCVNVYNGSSAWLMNCVLNAGTSAGVYGNQALLIRAVGCTSERTLSRGFHAHNGSVIEYTPTVTATSMTYETSRGKCISLAARAGSVEGVMGSNYGRYRTFDGLLIQWGTFAVTPTTANTAFNYVLTFPIPYAENPIVLATPNLIDPETCSLSVYRGTQVNLKEQIQIYITRKTAVSTTINWIAIGKGAVET